MRYNKKMSNKKAYVVASVVFSILFIFLLVIGLFFYENATTLKQEVIAGRQTIVNVAAAAVGVKISDLVKIASSMASNESIVADVANGQWADAADVTRDLQNDVNYYDTYIDRIVLFDTKGVERSAYPELVGGVGTSFSSSPYFQQVLEGAPYVVSNVARRASQPQIDVINILVPVSAQGTIAGVMELQIPVINFFEFGSDTSLGTYGFTYIVDSAGNIVVHPKFSSEEGNIVNVASTPIAQKVLSGNAGYDESYSNIDDERSVTTYAPVPVYKWGIVLQEPYNEVFSGPESILRTIEIESFVFVILDWVVAYLVLWLFKKKNKKNE
jgi:hypothetical protein